MKISMKLAYQYIATFFNFSTISNHLHPLQVENCESNSRLVVDEDAVVNSGLKGLFQFTTPKSDSPNIKHPHHPRHCITNQTFLNLLPFTARTEIARGLTKTLIYHRSLHISRKIENQDLAFFRHHSWIPNKDDVLTQPVSMQMLTNVVDMLGQSRRRWPNIKAAFDQSRHVYCLG